MGDSVGKISLDLEVRSDLNGQINGMAQKMGKEFEKVMKSATGSLDPEAFSKGIAEELEKAIQGISQAVSAAFQKSTQSAEDSVDQIGRYLNAMIDQALARVTDVTKALNAPDPTAAPRPAKGAAAQSRAPPGVKVKMPELKIDFTEEMLQARMAQIEQALQNIGKQIDVQEAKLGSLKDAYNRTFNEARKNKLQEQIVKTEGAIISLMGKMGDLGIQYDALDQKSMELSGDGGTDGGQGKGPSPGQSKRPGRNCGCCCGNAAERVNKTLASITASVTQIDKTLASVTASVNRISQALSTAATSMIPGGGPAQPGGSGAGSAMGAAVSGAAAGAKTASSRLGKLFTLIGAGTSKVAKASQMFHVFGGRLKSAGRAGSAAQGGMRRMLTTMLRYQIIVPIIMNAIRGMSRSLLASLSTNNRFSNSLKQIQSNLRVAFTPIYQAILPAINALMAALSTLSAYFAAFTSAIFGKSLSSSVAATKSLVKLKAAMGAYGGSASKAADSSKELQASLMGIDEINRLNDNADGGGGGDGGGGPETIEPPDMAGIDAAVMPWVQKFRDILSRVFQPFKEAWGLEGQATVESMKNALGNILRLAGDIGISWLNVWTNGTGTLTLSTMLRIFQNIFDIVGNLAGRLDEAWTANGNGERIIQGLFDLLQAVLDTVWKITDATAQWAAKVDFGPLLQSVGDVIVSLEPVVRAIGDTIADLWQVTVLPFLTWLIENAIPGVLETLSGLFGFLGEHKGVIQVLTVLVLGFVGAFKTVGTIFGVVEGVIGIITTLGGVFHAIGTGASAVGAAIAGISAPVAAVIGVIAALVAGGILLYQNWDTIKAKASETWTAVKATFEGFSQFLTGIFTTDWSAAFGVLGDCLNGFLATVNGVWESAKTIFDGIITFITGVFSGNWKQAWEGVVRLFSGIMQGMAAVMKAPLNAVIGLINGAIAALNQIHVDIPEWIPGLGGKSFGVNIPKIKYLATGGVVKQPTLAMMGEGGKKEAVVPLDRNLGWRDAIVDKINEGLDADGKGGQGFTLDELMARLRPVIMEAAKLFAGLVPQASQHNADTGDIIIPIYLDGSMLDEVIISAQQRKALRSGGR